MSSYYEQYCKEKGIHIPFWIQAVRDADKQAARERREILHEAMGIEPTPRRKPTHSLEEIITTTDELVERVIEEARVA